MLSCQQVLQHEIRKTHARNQKVEWVDDLVLMETIGKGGFGVVYKGSWKGSLAAIKVDQCHEQLICLIPATAGLQSCAISRSGSRSVQHRSNPGVGC